MNDPSWRAVASKKARRAAVVAATRAATVALFGGTPPGARLRRPAQASRGEAASEEDGGWQRRQFTEHMVESILFIPSGVPSLVISFGVLLREISFGPRWTKSLTGRWQSICCHTSLFATYITQYESSLYQINSCDRYSLNIFLFHSCHLTQKRLVPSCRRRPPIRKQIEKGSPKKQPQYLP